MESALFFSCSSLVMVTFEPFAFFLQPVSGFLNFVASQGQELRLELRFCRHGRENKARGKHNTELRSTLGHWASHSCPVGPPPALAVAARPHLPALQREAGWPELWQNVNQGTGLRPPGSPWQLGGARCLLLLAEPLLRSPSS